MRRLSTLIRRRMALSVAPVALAAAVAGCAYNPQLGRQQVLLVGEGQLAQAAASAWSQTLARQRVSNDLTMNRRVSEVGGRIIQAAGAANQPWEYRVFENSQANAFVLPGGKVGVNTGLFRVIQNDDQLAAVLGHEIAHSLARHAAERYSQTALAQIGLSVAQGAAGRANPGLARQIATFGGAGAQLGYLLPFSRQHELEADRLGLDYMARAGYRPSEAVALWRNMGSTRTGGSPPQFLSTHPSDATRIQQLQAYIAARGYR